MRKSRFALLAFLALSIPVRNARAQLATYCVNCSSELTTVLMKAEQIQQYLKAAEAVVQAIQQTQMMITEGQQLAQHPATNIAADLNTLAGIMIQAQGLAGGLAQMDAVFQNTYGIYTGPNPAYAAQYNAWIQTTLNTAYGSAGVAGSQTDMLANEQAWIAQIQAMSQQPMGRDQSLQLGNTIAAEEISQLQKLRQLMISDMSAKAAYTAQQTNLQQTQQMAQQNALADTTWTSDTRPADNY
jgi:P-type conjugative transfer protein TrbJ